MLGWVGVALFIFCSFIFICDPLDFERDIRGRLKPIVKSKDMLAHEIMVMEHELDIMGHHLDCTYCIREKKAVEARQKQDELHLHAEQNPDYYYWESIQEKNASGEIVCTYTYPTPITCITCGKIGVHTHAIAM